MTNDISKVTNDKSKVTFDLTNVAVTENCLRSIIVTNDSQKSI